MERELSADGSTLGQVVAAGRVEHGLGQPGQQPARAAAGAASATGCTRSGARFSFAHLQHSGVQPTHESEHGGQQPVDTGQGQWRRSR